ncbi:MAG: phosphatase PAP2 family protein [Marinicaulis sp.]|nr:phosphatase PAP2 family protein [Marinicaulis sp.]NNL88780.1 phosphatase PAP2 family protein [Marinicaulis sp.]
MGAGLFIFLALTAPGGAYLAAETNYLVELRGPASEGKLLKSDALRIFMQSITLLGGWTFLTGLGVLVVAFLLVKDRKFDSAVFTAAILGQTALSNYLKTFFGRERPDVVPHLVEAHTMSFPSGHATSAAAVYLMLALIIASSTGRGPLRVAVIVAFVVLAYLIGASRMFLGVHYPTDVFAGWALGTAWASFVWFFALKVCKNEKGTR